MAHPLMPKATAVWLVDNTTLTFDQIAAFCELHPLEVQGIADGEVAIGIVGRDPVSNSELTREEIERCEKEAAERLVMSEPEIPIQPVRKGPRYTPVSKRQNRPDAIAWLVKYHPELADAQVCKLVGTTKPTVNSVRDRTHWNTPNLKPEDPVTLGMCSQTDLDEAIATAVKRMRRREEREQKAAAKAKRAKIAAAAEAAAQAGAPVEAEAAPAEAPEPVAETPAPPETAPSQPEVARILAPARPAAPPPPSLPQTPETPEPEPEGPTVDSVFGTRPPAADETPDEPEPQPSEAEAPTEAEEPV